MRNHATRAAPSGAAARRSGAATTYKAAIEQTLTAIDQRAKLFRNLVVAVVAIVALSLAWALLARSLTGALLLTCLVPACGCFFYADAVLLGRWQSEMLDRWCSRELDLAAFVPAIRAHPTVPRDTLAAMLETLPVLTDLTTEQRLQAATRQAVSTQTRAVHRARATSLLLNLGGSVVAVGIIVAAWWVKRWLVLGCLTILVLRPALALWISRRRRALANVAVDAFRTQAGFDEAEYIRLVDSLR